MEAPTETIRAAALLLPATSEKVLVVAGKLLMVYDDTPVVADVTPEVEVPVKLDVVIRRLTALPAVEGMMATNPYPAVPV